MAHGIARRTNEIGKRMTLGTRGDIAWMVLRETVYLVLAGLLIGVPAALPGSAFDLGATVWNEPVNHFTLRVK